jgi:hypothetical protein
MVEMNEAAFKKAYDAFAGKKSNMPTKEKLFFAIRTYMEHANKHPSPEKRTWNGMEIAEQGEVKTVLL